MTADPNRQATYNIGTAKSYSFNAPAGCGPINPGPALSAVGVNHSYVMGKAKAQS